MDDGLKKGEKKISMEISDRGGGAKSQPASQAMNKRSELAFYIWAILNPGGVEAESYELQLIIRKGCASSVRLISKQGG